MTGQDHFMFKHPPSMVPFKSNFNSTDQLINTVTPVNEQRASMGTSQAMPSSINVTMNSQASNITLEGILRKFRRRRISQKIADDTDVSMSNAFKSADGSHPQTKERTQNDAFHLLSKKLI